MNVRDGATLEELLARLARIGPESRGLCGKMTPHQMPCHLNDSFGLALGERGASERIN